MKYRPEVDGLRALAVVSVLIYHSRFQLESDIFLPGGFLGVDIFFVISGYLITKILLQDISKGTFSYADFYERRARRILPVLLLILAVSVPFAWQLMLPNQLVEYAQSALAALLFSSNVVFWTQDSYTAEPSILKPLLHTWSLGVEEQFYIFFPIVLFLIHKWNHRLIASLVVGLLFSSLLFSEVLGRTYSDANFFLLPSRAWELLAGSTVAYLEIYKRINFGEILYAEIISGLSLIIIVYSLFTFNSDTFHPSLITAVPVFATAILILFANGSHFVNRLLSGKILVSLGLISYSLYLWHFPIFAFARLQNLSLSVSDKIVLCLLSLVLSIASYHCVEKPFRSRSFTSRKPVFITLSIASVIIIAIQTTIVANAGFNSRLGDIEKYISGTAPVHLNNGYSDLTITNPFVTLGDSHAGAFSFAVKKLAENNNRPFVQMVQNGCPLVVGAILFDNGRRVAKCGDLLTRRLEGIKGFPHGIFFYAGRFSLYQQGLRFKEELGQNIVLTNQSSGEPSEEWLKKAIKQTILKIIGDGHKLILIYPIPEMGFNVPTRFRDEFADANKAQLKQILLSSRLRVKKHEFVDRAGSIIETFESIPDHPNLIRLKPADKMCDDDFCYAHDDELVFYYDDNHLSPLFSARLIRSLIPELKKRNWIDN